jgi:predicted nucleotidyltransferase
MRQGGTANLESFLTEFASGLTSACPGKVLLIGVAGSAARGDFQPGRSDIDMLIEVKDAKDIDAVGNAAQALFWRLDESHGLRLQEAYAKKGGACPSPPAGGPNRMPFIIRARHSKRAGGGKLTPLRIPFLYRLFMHELTRHSILSGRLLFQSPEAKAGGHNYPVETLPEKLATYSFIASLAMLPLSIIQPDRALRRSARAVLFTYEDEPVLFRSVRNPSFLPYAPAPAAMLRFGYEALHIKKHGTGHFSYPGKVVFCLIAPLVIGYKNLATVLAAGSSKNGR